MGIKGKPKFEKSIEDMAIGEKGYIVPWALEFDKQGNAYLNTGFTIHSSPEGTVSMPIKRTGKNVGQYEIEVDFNYFGKKFKWEQKEVQNLFSELMGVDLSKIVILECCNKLDEKLDIDEFSKRLDDWIKENDGGN